jgi:Ca2+-binding RTX toxin-like protein
VRIDVAASKAGKLDAWIDWDRDGHFESAERIAANLSVHAGANTLVLEVPDDAASGITYARFRISSAGGLGPVGLAEDGEVEDHRIEIKQAPTGGVLTIPDPLFPGGTLLVLGGTSQDDALIFERYHPNDTIRAIHNGRVLASFPAAGVITRVAAVARAGNDDVVLDDELPQPAEFCGDAGDDSLFGSSGADYFKGGDGIDDLHGLAGADFLLGGGGNDVLFGDSGNDSLFGGAGNDVIYGGSGNDTAYGDSGNDTLYGDQGADVLLGNGGSDHLFGGEDRDVMIGGAGRDFLFGEGHDDLIVGASTAFDANTAALNLIRAEWASSRSYSLRVSNLRIGAGPILGGTGIMISGVSNLVADGVADDLFGNADLDWYLADAADNLFAKDAGEFKN